MSVAVILLNQVSIFFLISYYLCGFDLFPYKSRINFIGNVSKQGKHLIQMGNQIKKINIQMGKISSKRITTEKKF